MSLYIFDIDGTLADNKHREHLIKEQGWDAFFDACDGDAVIKPVMTLFHDLVGINELAGDDYVKLVVVTGRPGRIMDKTLKWFIDAGIDLEEAGIPIFHRLDGDHRPDHVIKVELLELVRQTVGEPTMVFDDRNSVVKMWRELGVPCAQVAEGDF